MVYLGGHTTAVSALLLGQCLNSGTRHACDKTGTVLCRKSRTESLEWQGRAVLANDMEAFLRRWLWGWEPEPKSILCEKDESVEGDMGKGAKKLGGAEWEGAIEP